MDKAIVKAVIDALFSQLEAKFSSRPLLLFAVHALHEAADGMLESVTAAVKK